MSLRSFKLSRVYMHQFNMSMRATIPGVEFLRILFRFKKRKENLSSYVHMSSIKRQLRRFHVVVPQSTSKKGTKKRDYVPLRATRSRPFSTWYKQFVLNYGTVMATDRVKSARLHVGIYKCMPTLWTVWARKFCFNRVSKCL